MLRVDRVTQSVPMSALWPPAIRADWLVLRRMGAVALVRIAGDPAVLLACCVALACGDFYLGYERCLVVAGLLALGGSHAITCRRWLDALVRWRFGWCGGLPTARGVTTRTLLLVGAAGLILSVGVAVALLSCVALPAPHRADLPYAIAGISLGLFVGTAAAAVRGLRANAVDRARYVDGIREPLFALPWLNDPRLPHMHDWQRRAALVKWRRGGGAAVVALALFAVPDGTVMLHGVGIILLLISLTWLDVVLRESVKVTTEAARLLQPTQSGCDRLRIASLRYPLLAVICSIVLAAAGAALASGGFAIMGFAGAACAIAVSVWPLKRTLAGSRHFPGPST